MSEESDTPETDAQYDADKYHEPAFSAYENMMDLAKKLERERNVLRTQIRENPFCEHCKEKDCEVSIDGECNMIREYLKGKKS